MGAGQGDFKSPFNRDHDWQDGVVSLAFSLDGGMLASAYRSQQDDDADFIVWDVTAGEKLRAVHGGDGDGASVVFLPDGRLLACGREGDDEETHYVIQEVSGLSD